MGTGPGFSTAMDVLVLLALAATIFFAARLSIHLKVFRAGRDDMEKLVADLGRNVARAEETIAGLRGAARESGRDLQALINEARAVLDELTIMTESAGNIAGRLERAAGAAPQGRQAQGRRGTTEQAPPPSRAQAAAAKAAPPSFAIRDPEFERGGGAEDGGAEEFGMDDDEGAGGLQSRAEKDLYEALRRGRKKTEAGGVP